MCNEQFYRDLLKPLVWYVLCIDRTKQVTLKINSYTPNISQYLQFSTLFSFSKQSPLSLSFIPFAFSLFLLFFLFLLKSSPFDKTLILSPSPSFHYHHHTHTHTAFRISLQTKKTAEIRVRSRCPTINHGPILNSIGEPGDLPAITNNNNSNNRTDLPPPVTVGEPAVDLLPPLPPPSIPLIAGIYLMWNFFDFSRVIEKF